MLSLLGANTPSPPPVVPGDFTVEAWMKFSSLGSNPQSLYSQFSSPLWFDVRWYQSAGSWQISFNSGSGTNMGGSAPTVNTWIHVAAVRSGSSVKLYLNGTATGTTITNSSALGFSGAPVTIGADSQGSNQFQGGSIGSLRVSRSAVYTSNFTPTTSTLSAIPGSTVLLTCQSGSIQDESGYSRTLTATGTVTPSLQTIGSSTRYVYNFTSSSRLTTPASSDFLFS